jgi:thiol-disulfide isomerase/thioredoxin
MSKPKATRRPIKRNPAGTRPLRPASRPAPTRRRWISRSVIGVALAVLAGGVIVATAANSTNAPAVTGQAAPDGSFTTTAGTTETVSALRGEPTLLWFVTTWCSSCQAGTAAMAQRIPTLAAHHVRVVELELAGDLGQNGPPITQFGQQLAGRLWHNPDWTFGTASSSLTQKYDPNGYLDIYYLFDAQGRVAYINSSPSATMGQLLNAAAKVGSRA